MIRMAIVEDEQQYAKQLREYVDRFSQQLGESFDVTEYSDGDGLVEGFHAQFDIILMDVEMPFLDGMTAAELIRRTDPQVVIIFITNMAQYAIRGYAVDALDYVLKPVSYFAFSQRLERAISRLKRRERKYIALPVKGGVRKLDHDLTFHTRSGNFRSGLTMRQAEEHLSGAHFFRGNNSYLINLEHVDGVQDGCAIVQGEQLKLSRPRKNAFLEALSNYMGEVMK